MQVFTAFVQKQEKIGFFGFFCLGFLLLGFFCYCLFVFLIGPAKKNYVHSVMKNSCQRKETVKRVIDKGSW